MAVLHPTPISTRQLSYHGGGKFACEMSDLREEPSAVYDDACDVGYTLVSHKTGREKVVALHRTEKDPVEGEVQWYEFIEVSRKTGRPETAAPVRLLVFND